MIDKLLPYESDEGVRPYLPLSSLTLPVLYSCLVLLYLVSYLS